MIREYYTLAKPGIVYGNLLPAFAGFALASKEAINTGLLFITMLGLGLIIASGCVFNNYIDRSIDAKMKRTQKRALVTGTIPPRHALVYGTVLGLAGTAFLITTTTPALVSALFGLFGYVVIYGIAKRKSMYATLIGSLPGAIPPVVGYTAVTGKIDIAAILLFLLIVVWQMPHFYVIAMNCMADYKAAQIPVLPLRKGIPTTKVHILIFIILTLLTSLLFPILGVTGITFGVVAAAVGILWIRQSLNGFHTKDQRRWAKDVFLTSLVVLMAYSATLALNAYLP